MKRPANERQGGGEDEEQHAHSELEDARVEGAQKRRPDRHPEQTEDDERPYQPGRMACQTAGSVRVCAITEQITTSDEAISGGTA